MEQGNDCIFCAIVDGRTGAHAVHEADNLLAFMDINPVAPGHVLVIPKAHAPHLADLDESLGAEMFNLAQRVAAALRRSGLRCEGVNLFLADGEAAFQEVFHTHLHVFPRFSGDAFRIDADWRRAEEGDLEDAARKIRAVLPLAER